MCTDKLSHKDFTAFSLLSTGPLYLDLKRNIHFLTSSWLKFFAKYWWEMAFYLDKYLVVLNKNNILFQFEYDSLV